MSTESPLLDAATRQQIVDEMREFRGDDLSAVRHFAFLVSPDLPFSIRDVEDVLNALAFPTLPVLSHLMGLELEKILISKPYSGPGRSHGYEYRMARDARQAYANELRQRETPSEPEKQVVSEQLKLLAAAVGNTNEKVFLEETLLCLEVGAYRAAIVMGWNLAFDHLRRFVFVHKLTEFNSILTTQVRKKKSTYGPVVKIEDFPEGEFFTLEVCREAGILLKPHFTILDNALKDRNLFAHPSQVQASPAIAAGHIDKLVRNIVADARFAI
jgi:hypothetical protein